MRDKLLAALRQAAQHAPGAVPGVAEVAALAQVSEAVVRRHLGPPENFAALLAYQAPAHETRERIIASAARVFGQKGFQRASLDEVAADAGMTKGAIYWHFKSKNDLFFAMLDERFRQHTGPLMGDLQSLIRTGADPLTTMLSLFRDGLRRCTEDPEWARLYLECLSLARDTEVRERLSAFYDRVWEVSARLTSELKANGLAPAEADPHTAAIFWSALFDGLVLAWLIKGDALDLERTTENIFRMLWRGIAPAQQE
jgi:TetR/AcrR family acrAB operon transcriptional repressor